MRATLHERRARLHSEVQLARQELALVEERAAYLRQQLLRLDGAMTLIAEVLAHEAAPTPAQGDGHALGPTD